MELSNETIVVGLTGQFGAGCTTVGEFLKEINFQYYSLSELVKQSLQEKITATSYHSLTKKELRRRLQDEGNELRKNDSAYLAREIYKIIEKNGYTGRDIVIDSIRNPSEVNFLSKVFSNFFLLALDASSKVRWIRNQEDYEFKDKEQFDKDDARDKGEDEPSYGQHTEDCVYMAHVVIVNEKQLTYTQDWDGFFYKVREYIGLMRKPRYRAPTYKELFMHMAYAISLKSSCSKRHVGAVIVSPDVLTPQINGANGEIENYILSTGYNDVPIGERICAELGGRHAGNVKFCARDAYQRATLRTMHFCPKCGNSLNLPEGEYFQFKCSTPGCNATLPKDFVPGRLLDLCRSVHAEEAAILQAAKLGSTSVRNTVLYTTTFPCLLCCKSIINAGIKKIVFREPYPMENSLDMLANCGIELETYEGVNAWAFDRMFRVHSI